MENKDKETISLKGIFVKYLRRWKFFLIVFIISFIPAILYLSFYPVTYEFKASIQIMEDKESSMGNFAVGDAAGLMKSFGIGVGGGSISIDDEMAILTSNKMLSSMILDLGMNVRYSKPYSFYKLYNEAPLRLTTDSVTMKNLDDEYKFNVSVASGNIKVKTSSRLGGVRESFTYTSLPAKIKVGPDEFTLDFDNDGAPGDKFKLDIICVPAGWLAEDLANDLMIEEVSSSSHILDLTCSDHSKDRGRDMLNTLIDKYNKDVSSYKYFEDSKTMAFVNARISTVLDDLSQVESDLKNYKTESGITLLESDVLLYSETMKDLQASIIESEAHVMIIGMLDEHVNNPENRYEAIPSLMTVATGEQGGIITKYNEALLERNRLLKNSNEINPQYKMLNSQVDLLRGAVLAMIDNARKSSQKTLEDLKAKENSILSKMRSVPEKEYEYRIYVRNQEIHQALYLMLLQKREETLLSIEKQNTNRARIVEPAYAKKKPLGPRKLYAAIGMLVFTLVIPIGYFLTKDLVVSIKDEYKRAE